VREPEDFLMLDYSDIDQTYCCEYHERRFQDAATKGALTFGGAFERMEKLAHLWRKLKACQEPPGAIESATASLRPRLEFTQERVIRLATHGHLCQCPLCVADRPPARR
jgi:hypothetical protein